MRIMNTSASECDLAYQDRALREVSRTFALTIPQLPEPLARVVGNGYLLCRIADTIEDDRALDGALKRHYAERFILLLEQGCDSTAARALGRELAPRLAAATPPAERELLERLPCVVGITATFSAPQRAALRRCVRIMARGMARFQQRRKDQVGLEDINELEDYCYHVAGVVGEMLTELFCDYSPEIAARRTELLPLSVSFGQGLQMTNILKDLWEDRRRGACWLPREIFLRHDFELDQLRQGASAPGFQRGLEQLLGITTGRLREALRYTLLIPRQEGGIRRFCLWALGMAVLTLRRIHKRLDFSSGQQVKISRRAVRLGTTTLAALSGVDALLRLLFNYYTRTLPTA